MTTSQEYALLSLFVYSVGDGVNRPSVPQAWTLLEAQEDNVFGFSYGVFRRTGTNEIVLAYTGTNGPIDWLSNVTASVGLPALQISNAALVYQLVKHPIGNSHFRLTRPTAISSKRSDSHDITIEEAK